MFALIIAALISLSASKQLQLTYSHEFKTLIVYQQNSEPVSLSLTFQNKDFSLHQSLKDKPLFFSKQGKNSILNLNKHIKFDYKIKMALKSKNNNEIMGSVGIGKGGSLYQLLKQALNSTSVKIEVRHKDGMMRAVAQSCIYPIFLPFMLTLSEANTHSYSIQKFSTNFFPDSYFLKVLNRDKSPFQMNKKQVQQDLTISLRDRVISVPLTELVHCGKYSNSQDYQCELQEHKQSDVAGLLFNFDPTFCGNSIEFNGEPESAWGFHYSHLVLLVLQFVLLGCLLRAERIKSIMNKALALKFS